MMPPPAGSSPVVAFDFDGTVADTLELAVGLFNKMAPDFGIPPLSRERARELRRLPSRALVQRFGGSYRSAQILRAVKEKLAQSIDDIEPIAGIPELIRQLHQAGRTLAIVSSNREDIMLTFLRNHGLSEYLSVLQGGSSIFGKARHLRRLCRRLEVATEELVYVGDETRDIEASRQVGADSVAVTWGANDEATLRACHPTWVARTPEELRRLIMGPAAVTASS